MQNFQAPPLNAASPFGAAGPLFKTVAGESLQASAVQASPFAAQGAAPTSAPLTVGDVLPQLPPDMVRMNGLSPDQPVAISAQVLDAALRSGQAALPLFEIYRVCPALFQSPVSPQDPRMVPLPAARLPRLIASAQQASAGQPPAMGASPFGMAPAASPAPASPFSAPAPGATALPPRRNGPPPPLADIQREVPASVSLPGGGRPPVFPSSPFAAAAVQVQPQPEPPQNSPFGVRPPEPAPAAAPVPSAGMFQSPSSSPPAGASPFGTANFGSGPAETPASPFAAFAAPALAPAPASSPPVAAPASPFASLFGSKAVPTGQQAPDVPAAPVTFGASPAAPAHLAVQSPAPAAGPNLRLSLASLLRGYSVAELGFDPIMVPTWIMTSQPAALVREWAQTPAPLVELGKLVDGITDVGFRNVLNHAKRDFQLKVPQEEITVALAGNGPPTLPNLSALGSGPPASAPSPVMTVPMAQPGRTGAPLFASGLPPGAEAPSFQPASPVAPEPSAQAPSGVPLFTAAANAASPVFNSASMGSFPAAPAAPISNPFARPAPAPAPSAPPPPAQEAAPPPPTAAFQPGAPFSQPEHPLANSGQEPPAPTPAYPQPPSDGFSSAELMGAPPGDFYSKIPPAPSIPVTNPFTGKEATNIVDVQEEPEMPPSPPPQPPALAPPPASSFIPPAFEPDAAPPRPRASPPVPAKPAPRSSSTASPAMGIKSHDTNPDQILLRALLGTDDDLTPQRVVEMVCSLPGIAACVCLQGDRAISHAGAHKPQAREFQKQATDLAHHLRTLAPLIGIENAETFTLTSGDRLMTFCFPEGAILGILHDADPSLGLRDKITLIARELSRMLD
ncbi:hypothetical protein WJU23_02640 [Prosthecobacter sp. SYSU 5D2]|uniref:hypothetical protein n=1 Tax=Prosthecobacter sp. SYSU 5D2 TaxID=3134134 RepID=UPI0031FF3993